MKSKILFSFFAVLLSFFGIAQINLNPSDNCTGVPSLTVGTSCVTNNYSMPGSFSNGGLIISTCASGNGSNRDDGWYSFVATGFSVNITETANRSRAVSIWTSCGSGTELGCAYATSGNTLSLNVGSLIPGTTYYIQIHRRSGDENGNGGNQTGSICLYLPVYNPSNTCTGVPPNLAVSTSCVESNYTIGSPTFTFSGVTPSCAVAGSGAYTFDGWYSFVATNDTISIEETANQNRTLAVWTACSSGTQLACSYATANNPNTIDLTGLSVGTTYFVQLYIRNNVSSALVGEICVSQPPPPGNTCATAIALPTVTSTCNTTSYSFSSTNNTFSGIAPGCNTSPGNYQYDGWYSFVATATTAIIDETGTGDDRWITVWPDCSGTNDVDCDYTNNNSTSFTVNNLTIGATYYIQIIRRSGQGNTLNGTICVRNLNNSPCSAMNLPVGPTCGYLIDQTTSGYSSSGVSYPGSPCVGFGSNGVDVWYSIVVPPNGWVVFDANCDEDAGMAIYSGSCGNLALISCDGGNQNPVIEENTLTPGDSIFIRVWRENDNNMDFEICVYTPDCSGTGGSNDFCENAAILTEDSTAVFGSSTNLYTADNSGNVANEFDCGSIQNNSWYAFVASGTTAVFEFNEVFCNDGIQAEVYEMDFVNGCCSNANSVSNCKGSSSTNAFTITATGLTVGETYYLMIDGWANSQCDFTINGWSATGVLPIKLIEFTGVADTRLNRLKWRTASEINSDVMVVQKSEDGINFTAIGSVKGAGNSTTENKYTFDDYEVNHTMAYYRLKQIDFDGTFEYSKTISVVREGEVELYPNPTNGDITVKFADAIENDWTITFTDLYGRNVTTSVEKLNASRNQIVFATDDLKKGYYFVKVLNGSGEQIFNNSFIKE